VSQIRRVLMWIALGSVVVVPVFGRVLWEGRAELRRADEAERRGDVDEQIIHLGQAVRWRLPMAGHDELSMDALLQVGRDQELRGEAGEALALSAYRELRRSLLGTRSWGVYKQRHLERANLHIATLMGAQERRKNSEVATAYDPVAYHLALLQRVPGPPATGSKIASLAFLLWVGASLGFVLKGLSPKGRLRQPAGARWGTASLALLVLWMVLMRWPELLR